MNVKPSTVLKNPIHFIAFGFGSGLAPKAPGTFGTLMAIPFYYLWLQYLPIYNYLVIVTISFIAGIFICQYSAEKLKIEDPPGIVWDEIVAFWLTMAFVPGQWFWIVIGFILFRFFDIVKPWPINLLDKNVKGGLGIMIDDGLAGLISGSILYLCYYASSL